MSPASASPDSTRGLLLGLMAAVSYSIANMALRQLVRGDGGLVWDVWVSGVKALPTAVIAGWMLWRGACRGERVMPPWRLIGPLTAAALIMQFGGNVGFQLSLRAIGLAITVPVVFASIILSGAAAGRRLLGDPVTIRTAVSMALVVISIGFLSLAAQESHSAAAAGPNQPFASVEAAITMADAGSFSWLAGSVSVGIGIALISGLSYGMCGVVIRRVVRGSQPVAPTLFLFSITGLITLCPLSGIALGWSGIREISAINWLIMLTAGTFNALGFFSITYALRLLTISRANVINASQNALCAVAAVVVFAEPLTSMTVIGIGLTMIGLLTLDRR